MGTMPGNEGATTTARGNAFGRFVIDPARGCLLSDGREIPLRPQTFTILLRLASRSGEPVSREELLDAAWPGRLVDDDTLADSINELRHAIGDEHGAVVVQLPDGGYRLNTAGAAPERRRKRGVNAFRWRWMYGVFLPLVVALVWAGIWFFTTRQPAPIPDARPTLAVLPFHNQSDDAAGEARADDFTRELITKLATQPGLIVKPWSEVNAYKGALAQPGEVARVLAVSYLLEGSVRSDGGQLRVLAQLADLQGTVLWSAQLVRPETETEPLREQMVREIAATLAPLRK